MEEARGGVKGEAARHACLAPACAACLLAKRGMQLEGGCSRTNPVGAWLQQAVQPVHVQVKREPAPGLPDLVAVKLEQASPGSKHDAGLPHHPTLPTSLNNASIPVGIAVARQRVADAGLLAALSHKDRLHTLHDLDAATAAMTVGVANVVCDERSAPLAWPAPPPAPAPAPLWQYPTAQVSMEGMMVGGVGPVSTGMPSVGGFQLVREPTSGALLLLPTPPELPHTVVWGGMPYPSAPLIIPPAPHPSHHLQILPGDILASTATLQHTHTHSTRLVTIAPAPPPQHQIHTTDKRKPIIQPLITPHTLIKLEAEPQEKSQPAFIQEPVQQYFYQSSVAEQSCVSQGTSPLALLTPQPETTDVPAQKDASNQTDHIEEDDDQPAPNDDDERDVACVGVAHCPEESVQTQQSSSVQPPSIDNVEDSSSESLATSAVVGAVEKAIDAIERDEALVDSSSSGGSHDLVIDTRSTSPKSNQVDVDVSGLELLSNSIEQFERNTPGNSVSINDAVPLTVDTRYKTNVLNIKTSPKSPPANESEPRRRFEFPSATSNTDQQTKPSLDGLGLLCALAEQRFMEEVEDVPRSTVSQKSLSLHQFVKSEPLHSPNDKHRALDELYRKEKHRHRDGDSSSERKKKRSRNREERLRYKLEKMRRYKRERDQDDSRKSGGDLEASIRRVTKCACGAEKCVHTPAVPLAAAFVHAIEKDMREVLKDLQRQCDEKRAQLDALNPPLQALSTSSAPSTPTPSPDSDRGSSKKRKVGRPRKVSSPDSTETIVAKKPKYSSSLVGYQLSKGKLKSTLNIMRDSSKDDTRRTSKVRPKLKAEPILKMYTEEDETEWGLNKSGSASMESLHEIRQKNREKVDKLARKHSKDVPALALKVRRVSASSGSEKERRRAKKKRKSSKHRDKKSRNESSLAASKCTLTEENLDSSPRVLTAMGGLFYAGRLSAVTAPDVYAITLDGERGNKPHILSREETLKDAILEVTPSSVSELSPGSRVCAYWSQQYRCLYPGTVVASTPDPRYPPEAFVAVEFDDGDSGTIALEDIRLLEPNYPVVEYENPLFTLGKRRRNASSNSTEEKKSSVVENKQSECSEFLDDHHKDRKRLKKHRRDKYNSSEEDPNNPEHLKKKRHKHKCEERCKHRRHHKKHRKRRKRHHSDCKDNSCSSSEGPRQRSSSECLDSKSNEDSADSDRLSTLIAMEKSPEENMKTVIKKAVVSKKSLLKSPVLDFCGIKTVKGKAAVAEDNLKDSGIGLIDEESVHKKSKKRTASSSDATLAGSISESTASGGKIATGSNSASNAGGSGVTAGVSKMAAFLPGGALWRWSGAAYRRTVRPRHKKLFYRAIQRGDEIIQVGEAAVFLSTGRPDRPYVGRVEALWQARGAMAVRVRWFYHPDECDPPLTLKYNGGLFSSPHTDENDVQTISHKCEVVSLAEHLARPADDDDAYYLAGHYDPTQRATRLDPDVPLADA